MFGTRKDFRENTGDHTAQPGVLRGHRVFRILAPVIGAFAQHGRLQITYRGAGTVEFGDGTGPLYRIRINKLGVIFRILRNTDLGCGEGYMNREWELDQGDLAGLICMFLRNERLAANVVWGRRLRRLIRLIYRPRRNDPGAARRNASSHYDLGNDLYEAFLDEGMNYSCAFFQTPGQSLRDAQRNKLRITIGRLGIEPGARVLDVGCGWGGLTRLIAEETPAGRITGITLASKQRDHARRHAGTLYDDRLDYRLVDYRVHCLDNAGSYDRIVSIGMFEHVGAKNFVDYFAAVRDLLADDGQALIHSIMRLTRSQTSPWIQKYIFPGGYIPTLEDTVAAAREAGLELAHEPFIHESFHYAETLRRWRAIFGAAWPRMDHTRYDERFRRAWIYYLAGSEAAFDARGMFVGQVLLKKV